MAKKITTTSDIWTGDIEGVKARVKAAMDRREAAQRRLAAECDSDDEDGRATYLHAAYIVQVLKDELFI